MPIRKKRRKTKQTYVRALDRVFSKFVRLRDSNSNGFIKCVTCGKHVHWKKSHCCHFIGRSNYLYRRDETNCRAGCSYCNTYDSEQHMKVYTLFMLDKFGRKKVEKMLENKWKIAQISTPEIKDMIEHYKPLVKSMEDKLKAGQLF